MNTFWEKIGSVATNMGVSAGTLRQWKWRGKVPYKMHYPLFKEAESLGINISLQELNKKQPKKQAP